MFAALHDVCSTGAWQKVQNGAGTFISTLRETNVKDGRKFFQAGLSVVVVVFVCLLLVLLLLLLFATVGSLAKIKLYFKKTIKLRQQDRLLM